MTAPETNEQTQTQAPLTHQDLGMCLNIINVAAERGAFKAEEMSKVGATHDRLKAFLASVAPAEAPSEAPAEAPTEAPAADENQ